MISKRCPNARASDTHTVQYNYRLILLFRIPTMDNEAVSCNKLLQVLSNATMSTTMAFN
jgi:hypothetical protein